MLVLGVVHQSLAASSDALDRVRAIKVARVSSLGLDDVTRHSGSNLERNLANILERRICTAVLKSVFANEGSEALCCYDEVIICD